MRTWLRVVALTSIVLLIAIPASTQSRGSHDELDAALRAARDADLKADWAGLLDARARVAAWDGAADGPALRPYLLAYIDWRLSSLAYLVLGPPGMAPLLERAVDHLRTAVERKPTFAEAQALLATCAGMLANIDRSRLDSLIPLMKAAWAAALEHGETNPRVQLLRAMSEVFVPPAYGGNPDKGLARWKQAIVMFEQEDAGAKPGAGPTWGHAEAWAWLGGAHLASGRHADAQSALEHAVRLRPDFWWAANAALPQARRPATK
jgi:tetratricopeptide (TPR) repeat protein